MTIAACDPEAFYPLRSLVEGPLRTLQDLNAIERFMRTVVLHDSIFMEPPPFAYDPIGEMFLESADATDTTGRSVVVAIAPALDGYAFFEKMNNDLPVPKVRLSERLLGIAAQLSNAQKGNLYYKVQVQYLERMLGVTSMGGSALITGTQYEQIFGEVQRYPQKLFKDLDADWQDFARGLAEDGISMAVPPVLSIVLTRARNREAIPTILGDLRDEWATARRKVWGLISAISQSRTLCEARDAQEELSQAARLFSPACEPHCTEPTRVLWDVFASAITGSATAAIAGGHPVAGALVGGLGQVGKTLVPLTRDFGREIFGSGAFDLARRVRRATENIEIGALSQLLSEEERTALGLA